MTLKRQLIILILALAAFQSQASELSYTYAPDGAVANLWGTSKAETYNVAIRLDDPGLVGKKITAIEAPILSTADMADCRVWLAKSLDDGDSTVASTIVQKGFLDTPELQARLAEPFEIPAEGIYVGYSFTILKTSSNLQRSPVVVTNGDNANGLFVKTSTSYPEWTPLSESLGRVSMTRVTVEGDFPANAVAVGDISPVYALPGSSQSLGAKVFNHSLKEVKSLSYSYSVGGTTAQGVIELPKALSAQFGSEAKVEFPINVPQKEGVYELSLTIQEVDGEANGSSAKTATGTVTVLNRLPVNRPLMEEYTGMWCGWCPSGYVAMEMMKEEHPSDFVCVSYHNNDELDAIAPYPSQVSGYPAAYMNRNIAVNPWYGLSDSKEFGINDCWQDLHSQFTPADISVGVAWADDSRLSLTATADVEFIMDCDDADYRLSFILLGDGLSSDSWVQNNSYAGNTRYSGKYWNIFTRGSQAIIGLVYNDVALKYEHYEGIPGSLPSSFKAFEKLSYSYTFDLMTVTTI